MGKIIGIDLGTTNSCVAVMEGGVPTVIVNAEGARTTPSVVGFSKNGERLIGAPAKRQAITNPDRTVISIKRQMGSEYRKNIDGRSFTPQEISAMILRKLKKDAEDYLGCEVTEAVITVPAYFSDAQRQATKDAGRIAGLDVKRIINEPTSAALAYGLDNEGTQKVMVYDLGGGTFDVSIIQIGGGVVEVLATAGDNHLGGDDFDERLAKYMVDEFRAKEGSDLSGDVVAMQRIREEAERVKKELSSAVTADFNLPFITAEGGGKHLQGAVTRSRFEEMTFDLLEKTVIPVKNALESAGMEAGELDKVLLVGGSTRMPAVQEKVRMLTGKEPARNINPDECVAIGAAIQGGKLAGEAGLNEILLLDVTPLSLSIETVGGVSTVLIEKNSTIPTRYSRVFTTAGNFQTSVDIKVYQGERQMARDNKLIGNFRLKGIKRAMQGVPQIEVTFDIDVNGILNVSARDLDTGRQQSVTITASSNLSEEEIERARRDAEEFASQDAEKRRAIDIRNEAESYIYQVENLLAQEKKTMDKEHRKQIKGALSELKKAAAGTKPETITPAQGEEILRLKENLERIVS